MRHESVQNQNQTNIGSFCSLAHQQAVYPLRLNVITFTLNVITVHLGKCNYILKIRLKNCDRQQAEGAIIVTLNCIYISPITFANCIYTYHTACY